MELYPYWQQQTPKQPLFPDIEWAKPEQRVAAGTLGIIGGSKLGFSSVAESYATALQTGAGEVRVVLPDALKKVVPKTMTDVLFAPTNLSGSLSRDAGPQLQALSQWASEILLIGDAGRSSETAILYEDFLRTYTGPLTITRDAIDLVKNSSASFVERPQTLLVVSFAQLQKLFQAVYYPKVLTFSMQLTNLVEAVHKFTITYPVAIMVLHKDHLVVGAEGIVTTTAWQNPMAIWRGAVATKAACYWLWNQGRVLQAATASLLNTH